jgi:hypothetical protein
VRVLDGGGAAEAKAGIFSGFVCVIAGGMIRAPAGL